MYVVMTGIDPKEAEYVEVHNQAFKTEKEADTWGRDCLKKDMKKILMKSVLTIRKPITGRL